MMKSLLYAFFAALAIVSVNGFAGYTPVFTKGAPVKVGFGSLSWQYLFIVRYWLQHVSEEKMKQKEYKLQKFCFIWFPHLV